MNIGAGGAKLSSALKKLREHWEVTKEDWQDRVQEKYEKDYLGAIDHQSMMVLREMDRLGQVLQRAVSECQ
ncbi:MAG: hypothetical protein ACRDD1_20295 [Planctomycetia bacterium]